MGRKLYQGNDVVIVNAVPQELTVTPVEEEMLSNLYILNCEKPNQYFELKKQIKNNQYWENVASSLEGKDLIEYPEGRKGYSIIGRITQKGIDYVKMNLL